MVLLCVYIDHKNLKMERAIKHIKEVMGETPYSEIKQLEVHLSDAGDFIYYTFWHDNKRYGGILRYLKEQKSLL
jgi:hypothetical protein